ncbi:MULTISPECIES: PIG-L deacetylase family protein [unclassified Nocardiopsis]|uniref:PIG-L deacetylase family protein n=1 Tax=unclassified Nocardiopsis TaxID=2649073 RepID=UPI001F408992|nr:MULTISPECIES: PIG-L deacetylase family protein [unclassified Nocardiopsis]
MRPPRSVMTVMAHPDDAELWAGGYLALCARAGSQATVALPCHDSERDAEAEAGAAVLGAQVRLLDHADSASLAALVEQKRPEVVITHPVRDVHPDHRRVAEALLEALPEVVISTGLPQRVYTADSYNGLTLDGAIAPATMVDVSDTFETKMRALSQHRSQPIAHHFGPMADTLARLWGARIGVAHAENYTPLPVLGRLPHATHL